MHAQEGTLLAVANLLVFLSFVEEPSSGAHYVFQFNAPECLKLVDDLGLFIECFHDFLASHVVEPKNSIADSG